MQQTVAFRMIEWVDNVSPFTIQSIAMENQRVQQFACCALKDSAMYVWTPILFHLACIASAAASDLEDADMLVVSLDKQLSSMLPTQVGRIPPFLPGDPRIVLNNGARKRIHAGKMFQQVEMVSKWEGTGLAIQDIAAPIDIVWEVLWDCDRYQDLFPRIVASRSDLDARSDSASSTFTATKNCQLQIELDAIVANQYSHMPYNISIQFESVPQHNSLLWRLNRIGDTATTTISLQPMANEVNFISDMVGHWYIAPHPDLPTSTSRITYRVQLVVLDPDSLEDHKQTEKERKRLAQSAKWLSQCLRKLGMTHAMTLLKTNAEKLRNTATASTTQMSTNTSDMLILEERQLSRDDAPYTVFEDHSSLLDEQDDEELASQDYDKLVKEPDTEAVSADPIMAEVTESSIILVVDASHDGDIAELAKSTLCEEPPKICSPEPSQREPQLQPQPQLQPLIQQQPFQNHNRTMISSGEVADIGWKRYGLIAAVCALSLYNLHLFVS